MVFAIHFGTNLPPTLAKTRKLQPRSQLSSDMTALPRYIAILSIEHRKIVVFSQYRTAELYICYHIVNFQRSYIIFF